MKTANRFAVATSLLAVYFALCACVHLDREDAVPAPLTQKASATEATDARFWPELDEGGALKIAVLAASREREALMQEGRSTQPLPPASYLAISSGGDDGAFAAGLLVGWASRGDRPTFDVVTGVSAGALIAPFAFLGSQYDPVLRAVSSRIEGRDIFRRRNLLAALASDSMADDRPLAAMIEKHITQEVLRDVARAYAKGRLLFIGTTNLDARQLVIWDMGAIASRADAAALGLFRKIILASTAIPGVFPPVMIDVEAGGKHYQEMHVDGGVMTQVFLFPLSFVAESGGDGHVGERVRHIYIIRNGRIDAQWGATERRTTVVAYRALDALVDRQALGDIYRLQLMALQDGADLNIAYIDSGFDYPHRRLFAGDYMQHLFRYSYDLASNGYRWCKALPSGEDPSLAGIRRSIGSQLSLASADMFNEDTIEQLNRPR
jgi:predicted acylesterase/phospholipase RssA